MTDIPNDWPFLPDDDTHRRSINGCMAPRDLEGLVRNLADDEWEVGF